MMDFHFEISKNYLIINRIKYSFGYLYSDLLFKK